MAKQHIKNTNPFAQEDALTPIEQAAQELYGGLKMKQDDRQVAKPVSILKIWPDLAQPRRAIPLEVRKLWDGNPNSLNQLFSKWLKLINETERYASEPEHYLDVDGYLTADGDLPENPNPGPLESSFMQIVDLAASIRRDGLTNPITIAKQDDSYVIETGERRWMAYHMLHAYFVHEDKWSQIPARLVDAPSVWRQATENAARQDLNAIGRARQLARLLIDYFTRKGEHFTPFEELVEPGKPDRPYYAQVITHDGQYDIPHGHGELFANAMGFKNKTQLRQYKRLFKLPNEAWQKADEFDLEEGVIRRLFQQAGEDDDRLKELIDDEIRNRVTRVTRYGKPNIPNADPPTLSRGGRGGGEKRSPEFGIFTKLARLRHDRVGGLPDDEKDLIRDQIAEARLLLDNLEELLDAKN